MSIVDIRQELEREIEVAKANLSKLEQALALLGDGGPTSPRRGRPRGQKNGRVKRGTAVDAVLEAVAKHPDSKPALLAKESGLTSRSVYATTNRLLGEGRLARGEKGGYIIAPADEAPAKKKPARKKEAPEPAAEPAEVVNLLKPQED